MQPPDQLFQSSGRSKMSGGIRWVEVGVWEAHLIVIPSLKLDSVSYTHLPWREYDK